MPIRCEDLKKIHTGFLLDFIFTVVMTAAAVISGLMFLLSQFLMAAMVLFLSVTISSFGAVIACIPVLLGLQRLSLFSKVFAAGKVFYMLRMILFFFCLSGYQVLIVLSGIFKGNPVLRVCSILMGHYDILLAVLETISVLLLLTGFDQIIFRYGGADRMEKSVKKFCIPYVSNYIILTVGTKIITSMHDISPGNTTVIIISLICAASYIGYMVVEFFMLKRIRSVMKFIHELS